LGLRDITSIVNYSILFNLHLAGRTSDRPDASNTGRPNIQPRKTGAAIRR